MRIINNLGALTLLLAIAVASPTSRRGNPGQLPVRTVFQQSTQPAWLENLAIRSNGNILATQLIPNASIIQVANPDSSPVTTVAYTFDFSQASGLMGITETLPDTFAFLGGIFDPATLEPVNGSFNLWELSFVAGVPLVPRKVAPLAEYVLPNGIISLPADPTVVLAADCMRGLVFRVDTKTGAVETTIQVPEMAKQTFLGINGVKIRDGYLYFSNSDTVTIYRIKITADGYLVSGATAETVAVAGFPLDDFTFDGAGNIWAATNPENQIIVIKPNGEVISVAGSATELTVAGVTAVLFGRTYGDADVLYGVTSGGLGGPVNGTITEPAKVVAVDTSGFH